MNIAEGSIQSRRPTSNRRVQSFRSGPPQFEIREPSTITAWLRPAEVPLQYAKHWHVDGKPLIQFVSYSTAILFAALLAITVSYLSTSGCISDATHDVEVWRRHVFYESPHRIGLKSSRR